MKPKYNNDDTVTISADEYQELLIDSKFLNALQAAGVDNWSGYDCAIDILQEYEDES